MKHCFSSYHPVIILGYLVAALVGTMSCFAPVYVLLSLACSTLYGIYLLGIHKYLRATPWMLGMVVVVIVVNIWINPRGESVLFFIGSRPMTLEALYYGLCIAGMLLSSLNWFLCYGFLMSSDKFLYLFARIAPTAALMLCMILRLIPEMLRRMRAINDAHSALSPAKARESLGARVVRVVHSSSVLLGWSLEEGLNNTAVLYARGYGVKRKRTSFFPFRMRMHDYIAAGVLLLLCVGVLTLLILGGSFPYEFYPSIAPPLLSPIGIAGYVLYTLLLLFAPLLEVAEGSLYRRTKTA